MGVDEIDDVRVADAIHEVAERAAEDERKAPLEGALVRREAAVERHDERDRERRDQEKERATHVLRRVLQEAPRAAAVFREHEVEVAFDELDGMKKGIGPLEALFGPELGSEIGNEGDRRDDREKHVRRVERRGCFRLHALRRTLRAPGFGRAFRRPSVRRVFAGRRRFELAHRGHVPSTTLPRSPAIFELARYGTFV
jgi:hypothetical protein